MEPTTARSSQNCNSTILAESLWKFINNPVVTILSDLQNAAAEQMLRSLLDSIQKGSANLRNILVPPVPYVEAQNDIVLCQYTAFTTWLFGTMFYVMTTSLTNEIIISTIEIQACMLRVLSIHHMLTFSKISMEYIKLTQELLEFNLTNKDAEEVTLYHFQTERNVIENLDLVAYPVKVKFTNISSIQLCILKIIMKSGVSAWNQKQLCSILLKVIIESAPDVKVKAIELVTKIMKFSIDNCQRDETLTAVVAYSIEIIRTIPMWQNLYHIPCNVLNQYVNAYTQLINLASPSLAICELCLQIIEFITHTFISARKISQEDIKSLEKSACTKIRQYLHSEPRHCTPQEIIKFKSYFKCCPEFIAVLGDFVFIDIKYAKANDKTIAARDVSEVWKLLQNELFHRLHSKQFKQSLNILQVSHLLESRLVEENIKATLYGEDLNDVMKSLVGSIDSDEHLPEHLIFENFIYMFGHNESDKETIQSILSLPLSQTIKCSVPITEKLIQAAKSLDTITKVKCLTALCEFGYGKQRLKLLHECVVNADVQLAVGAIMNTEVLIKDSEIQFEDISNHVLQYAISSGREEMHEAVAKVLGNIVCSLSRRMDTVRPSNNFKKQWDCKCSRDNANENGSFESCCIPKHLEHFVSIYFDLLSSKSRTVCLYMSRNLISLSRHVETFNTNELAKKWLMYMHHEDIEIRSNVATAIGKLLSNKICLLSEKYAFMPDDVPIDLIEFVHLVIDAMSDVLVKALNMSNHSLHNSLLVTAKNFACVSLHLTERQALNILLITVMDPSSSPAAVATACVAFKEVATFLNISQKALYMRYKKDFLKLIIQRAVSNYVNYSYNIATSVHQVAKCMGFEGSRHLLRKDGHYAVCFLLNFVIQVPQAIILLNDIAELISMDEKQMMIEYFPHICSHVFLNMPLKIGMECLRLITRMTEMSLIELTKIYRTKIFGELMLNFHEFTEKVIGFLEILALCDGSLRINFSTQEQVALYLKPQLHGILVSLDVNLGPKFDEYTQRTALASLASLMRYMGAEYLTPLRYKILATLRTSLEFKRPGFGSLACDTWDAFIHNIAIKDLGPLLPTICVSIVPLLKMYPQQSNAMLEFLIVQNSENISEHISELFFIDDINVNSDISNIVKAHILQARSPDIGQNLKLWLKQITHETDKVRVKALMHLRKFLAAHRTELNDMILSNTDVHPLIVDLLDTLLIGCQDTNESIRILYGECLGELGAIEPSLLPRRIISREDSKFIADINEEFACAILSEFVRAFQIQKNTQSMDCFSLAIQETLKTYDISPQGRNNTLWDSLPSSVKQMIFPFLTSHYKITVVNDDVDHLPHPIYGSESGSSFESWAYNWLCNICSSIDNEILSNMLHACRPAFKRDVKTMTFCLPYVVSYIVTNGNEQMHNKLREEMLAVINVREDAILDTELMRHRPLRHELNVQRNNKRISDEARRTQCSQVVFSILDHLQRWLRESRLKRDIKYEAILRFCEKFDSLVVAEGCYQFREYHRALMYLEQHMASTNKGLSEATEGGLLAKIYAQLDEPDGVSGILATQDQSPTLQQLVLAHEVNGQLQDAATCYERLAQRKMIKPSYLQGMIQCYLGLDQPFTAMNITEGVLSHRPELEPLIVDHEPFWRLAHFTRLDDTLHKNVKHSLLKDITKGLQPDLSTLKTNLVSLLEDAARPGAYQQSYSYIMKLHILNEFEKAASMMLTDVGQLTMIFEEWEKRGQLLRASRGVEFVLSMRRATLDLALQLQNKTDDPVNSILKKEIGKIWLKSAKIARKAGFHQQAYMYILSASDCCPPQELHIEQAQLYWQKGCQEEAFITLKRCFMNYFQSQTYYKKLPPGECIEERRQCAKAKLLFAKYNDETLNVDTDANMVNYKEAYEVWRAWEKSLLSCAQYYESVVNRMADDDKDIMGRDLQVHMMNYYGKSLQYGCKYIHQSMPRMLTIWLNFASRITTRSRNQAQTEVDKLRQDCLAKMTRIMEVYQDRLPTFMWLTAFSQLVSRICHPSVEVQKALCIILVKLISAYPQYCLWTMASVINSSYPARHKRCQEILGHATLKTLQMSKLIKDFNRLWEYLIELCNKPIPNGTPTTSVSQLSRHLPRLLANKDFSSIMIPTTKFTQLRLPSKGTSVENHNPFPLEWVRISGIEDTVVVMASMQRPRRITLKGSDGKNYLFMCKPKDDLRKDFRLMEFNDIVNKYLQKDPESRQRRLYIRTYNVIPLNEECGLLEWIPNLIGFRPILLNLYAERGITVTNRELRSMMCKKADLLEVKREMFLEKLLPRHPAVLGYWFRLTFPDPYGWYEARTAFIRTTAVMSMVGYILGLGDRHGENILLDSKCGDCVHVDFNCLFNQGETFNYPERVPFRLTHNMTDAMGPLKIEGPFRRACQTTMRVLRQQSSTLISVLTPFVYDPLVSWNKNRHTEAAEKTNEEAVEHVKNIEQRLKGLVRPQGKKLEGVALNLSIEGQTNHLILEATSVDNLCQMYIGWGAYM